MGYVLQIEKGGLHDLLVCIQIGFKARKNPFSHGIEKPGIPRRRKQDEFSLMNQFSFSGGVIRKIWFHPESQNLGNTLQSAAQGDKLLPLRHTHVTSQANAVRVLPDHGLFQKEQADPGSTAGGFP